MKRLALSSLALLLVGSAPARAVDDNRSSLAVKSLEGTVTKKKEGKDPFHGFNIRLGLRAITGVNYEPEAGYLDLSYQFVVSWAIGKTYAAKGSWASKLSLAARMDVSHEPVGYNPYYRTAFMEPNYRFALADQIPIGDRGYFLTRDGYKDIPRTQKGGGSTARVSDLMLTLAHPEIYKIPKVGIDIDGLIRLMFPSSKRSQNATLNLALTGALGLSRTFKWKAGGKVAQDLTLGYTFGFTGFFHRYETGQIELLEEPEFTTYGDVPVEDTLANQVTTMNPVYAYSNDFSLSYGFYKGWKLSLGYSMLGYKVHKLNDNCLYNYDPTDPGAVLDLCDQSRDWIPGYNSRGEREMHGFSATLAYQPLSYLNLMLTLATQAPQRKPSSEEIQQPFFVLNRNGYSAVMLTAYFSPDALYKALQKGK